MSDTIEEFTQGDEPVEELPLWQTAVWTAQELTYVSEYLTHRNVARAWRKAMGDEGLEANPVNAHSNGLRWSKRPHIASYIEQIVGEFRKRLAVTKDNVLEELAKLAYANQADFIVIQQDGSAVTDLSGLTREQLAAIQEVTVETYLEGRGDDAERVKRVQIKLAPKIAALELLGKTMKMFTDVVEDNREDVAERLRDARRRMAERRKQEEEADANSGQGDGAVRADDGSDDPAGR